MANTQMSSPTILPQEQSLQLLTPDQDSIQKLPQNHQQHQQQQQQDSSISLYQNQPYHHHHVQDQLDDMTREFLMQEMAADPNQQSQTLLQIPHACSSSSSSSSSTYVIDEELNIYDYIYAKQEGDDDEHDGDDHGHALSHEHGPDPNSSLSAILVTKDNLATFSPSASADANPINVFPHHHQSPVPSVPSPVLSAHSPSSPTLSTLSPSSPSSSLSSNVQHYDHSTSATAATVGVVAPSALTKGKDQDSDILGATHIKQECIDSTSLLDHNHSSYMDTSMDLYGSTHSPLLSSQSDLMPPPQDLFRVLMEELQTQASIQREKFFSATTGSGTGMDSVEFLFNGPQTQGQHQIQSQTHVQKSVPQFMMEPTAIPDMLSNNIKVGSAGQESSGSISEPSSTLAMNIENPSPPLDFTQAATPSHVSTELCSDNNDDVNMETADPEGDIPLSPIDSSSSSGSVTPELTSPVLQPCSPHTRTSPKAEVVRVAFTRLANQRSKPSDSDATAVQSSKVRKDSLPSIVFSITELSFQNALENNSSSSDNHNTRRRSAESIKEESLCPSVIAMKPAPRKRRKLSRDSDDRSPDASPRLSALPSPPSSVRTTPPLQPMTTDASSGVESLSLPPACGDSNDADISQPVTPTSPLLSKSVIKLELTASDEIMETVASEADAEQTEPLSAELASDPTKALPPNANNKRSWTSEEEALLLKLVENRTPIKDIAETLNRSVHSVRSRRQVLTDPGFVKGNGHAQPRRSKPDPSSKLPTYSQMAFLSLARLPELQGTLNDVASMVEKLFSRYLNRIPRTGHKNLQIWRAQISDALAHEKGHPRPRFESFGVKRGRQWVYRLTDFGKGVVNAMGSVDQIYEDLLKNNEAAGGGSNCGPDGESSGGAGAGLGQGNGYGYSYCPEAAPSPPPKSSSSDTSLESDDETNADNLAASNAIANAMAAMAAGLAAMTAVEDEKSAAVASAATNVLSAVPTATASTTASATTPTLATSKKVTGSLDPSKEKAGRASKSGNAVSATAT
ncbi:hypothetical protein BGZ80_003740, partial [Entomortierella chlamydospora]